MRARWVGIVTVVGLLSLWPAPAAWGEPSALRDAVPSTRRELSRPSPAAPDVRTYLDSAGNLDVEALRCSGHAGAIPLDNAGPLRLSGPRQAAFPGPSDPQARVEGDQCWLDGFGDPNPLPGVGSYYVYCLAVYDGALYAGGWFFTANGVETTNLARWDGTRWSSMGSGMGASSTPFVQDMLAYGGDLYVGGRMRSAGAKCSLFMARWNGAASAVEDPRTPESSLFLAANPYRAGEPIRLLAPAGRHPQVSIFDPLGRRVRTLHGEVSSEAETCVRWDGCREGGARAPSGVYYIQATSERSRDRRVLILVR